MMERRHMHTLSPLRHTMRRAAYTLAKIRRVSAIIVYAYSCLRAAAPQHAQPRCVSRLIHATRRRHDDDVTICFLRADRQHRHDTAFFYAYTRCLMRATRCRVA